MHVLHIYSMLLLCLLLQFIYNSTCNIIVIQFQQEVVLYKRFSSFLYSVGDEEKHNEIAI